jgi:excisionase family DNA binding protein
MDRQSDIYDEAFEADFIGKPRLVTKTEAARLLGISRPTLYKWIHDFHFPVIKVGGIERVDMGDVERWLVKMKK